MPHVASARASCKLVEEVASGRLEALIVRNQLGPVMSIGAKRTAVYTTFCNTMITLQRINHHGQGCCILARVYCSGRSISAARLRASSLQHSKGVSLEHSRAAGCTICKPGVLQCSSKASSMCQQNNAAQLGASTRGAARGRSQK